VARTSILFLLLLLNSGCKTSAGMNVAPVSAVVRDSSGRVLGNLTVTERRFGLAITGTLTGLPPGSHGVHLHQTGRCEPTFEAAGPHWNPDGRQHGLDNPAGPHRGDLDNVTADAGGTVLFDLRTRTGRLRGDTGILDSDGAAIVVHAAADDYKTDPSGNSGARIACGVLGQ
jgi:superoxide dismutase, Cu-Zn family